MERPFLAFRRDLPGGRIAMIEVEQRPEGGAVGRLLVERRADPDRRRLGRPPVVAEVTGASGSEVLAQLRAHAASDAEIARLLEAWQASRR
jgi:hypothetical protein